MGRLSSRLMAHLSKDPAMLEMFNNGVDFHSYTSERMGINRDRAKVLNLSVGYQSSTFKSVGTQLGGSQMKKPNYKLTDGGTCFPRFGVGRIHSWENMLQNNRVSVLLFSGGESKWTVLQTGTNGNASQQKEQLINNIAQASVQAEVMANGND